MAITKEQVIGKLKEVIDPEIRLDVWTLGLIYDLQIKEEGKVWIKMTFTTPFCPYGEALLDQIRERLAEVDGVTDVDIEVTFEPAWKPPEEVKAMFGLP